MSGPDLYGLVLAGGASKRMGSDKGAIAYSGRPEAERCYNLLGGVCSSVWVSTRAELADAPGRKGLPQIHDRHGHIGPIDGILSALQTHSDHAWLVVACDLPFLDAGILRHLVASRDPTRPATAFISAHDGLPEPLCAIYEPAMRARLKTFVAEGVHCPRKALIRSNTNLVALPDPRALDNINTPAERDAAQRSMAPRKPVLVQYYAQLREHRGLGEETIETTAHTAADLYRELKERHGFPLGVEHVKVAVNTALCSWSTPLQDRDRVAFLPPVAGG